MRIRGQPHMLLIGDPGTGKSQFLKYASKLVPRSVLTTGIGSSSAGLTVTAVRDGGEWQLEAGALVLADRGLCCIDEFGSIREHDKLAIHEAMEQQTISIAKAGIVTNLNTRCSVLAATNTIGKYDSDQSVSINVALSGPLLSRFDLVLVLIDSQNDVWDRVVSSFVLGEHFPDMEEQQQSTKGKHLWDIERLKTYLQYVKSNFRPPLSRQANLVLQRYYQAQRQRDLRNAARTTLRLLESLIRLAQAHARLMAHHEVDIRDAVVVVGLMETSMMSSALIASGLGDDSNTGWSGSSALHDGFPDDPEAEYLKLEEAVLKRLGLEDLRSEPSSSSSGVSAVGNGLVDEPVSISEEAGEEDDWVARSQDWPATCKEKI
ncbi:uncharacterized protein VTP21DRAFT_5745 [Calcarisporiella thermophila]|uniref:uncharacterized protein n=1 Tax=Calcarisporiella thermophila TaxID=911321 RepID=UPI0037428CBF